MLDSRIHSKSGVKLEELVVDRSFLLDALNLNLLGVIGGPPLRGLWCSRVFSIAPYNTIQVRNKSVTESI